MSNKNNCAKCIIKIKPYNILPNLLWCCHHLLVFSSSSSTVTGQQHIFCFSSLDGNLPSVVNVNNCSYLPPQQQLSSYYLNNVKNFSVFYFFFSSRSPKKCFFMLFSWSGRFSQIVNHSVISNFDPFDFVLQVFPPIQLDQLFLMFVRIDASSSSRLNRLTTLD